MVCTILLKLPITLYKYYIEIGEINLEWIGITISRLIPAIFLFQSYIPNINFYYAFNGVAWFLDVIVLCYLLTPWIINKINQLKKKKLILMMIIIGISKILYNQFLVPLLGEYAGYASYIFPFYRLFDYIQGILLGGIFLKMQNGNKSAKSKMSILEVGVLVLIVLGYHFRLLDTNRTVQEFLSILIVYIFAFEGGIISRILNNKILIYLGNISMELYLIHQPVIKYFEFISNKLANQTLSYVFFIAALSVTLILAYIFNKYIKKYLDSAFDKVKYKILNLATKSN